MNDNQEYWKRLSYGLTIWSLLIGWRLTTAQLESRDLKETTTTQNRLLKECHHENDSLIKQQVNHINKCKFITATAQ